MIKAVWGRKNTYVFDLVEKILLTAMFLIAVLALFLIFGIIFEVTVGLP